ncbi:MAG: esterase family protein [Bacteroidales bacterium]|nr:esterase family protein [Bacteroidales bacterium]
MTRSKFILLLALALLGACKEKERVLPDIEPDPEKPTPRYATGLTFHSSLMGIPVAYDIMVPDRYAFDTDKSYPVVYCFHGYGDNNTSWNKASMNIQSKVEALERQGLIPPMIFVFPMGYKTYFCDRWNGEYSYMTMFVTEFVPMIDRTYRTIADKDHRTVIGYSMGAFGALATTMQHPEVFSSCGAMSISMRTDEQYKTESQGAFDNQWGSVFGGVGSTGSARLTEYYESICPLHQFTAENLDKYSGARYFITCGDDENSLLYGNDELHAKMVEAGYDHEYRVGNGGHDEAYWRAALDEILPWFAFLMDGGTDWEHKTRTVEVPDDCEFQIDGSFLSQGYINNGKTEGTGIYLFYKGLEKSLVNEAIAILQRGNPMKKYLILPCEVTAKSVADWIGEWDASYTITSRQAIAVGEAGTALIRNQTPFSYLYFENAFIEGDIQPNLSAKYYIGQSDNSQSAKGIHALYVACKDAGASFEYRCRDHVKDAREDFLMGFEFIKGNLKGL